MMELKKNNVHLFLLIFLFISCTNKDTADKDAQHIYFDYKVWADEEDSSATCMLQYRFGGPNGSTVTLQEPAQVEMDGQLLKADSSTLLGNYYELSKSLLDFEGKHEIVFTGFDKKQFKEDFDFIPFRLSEELPDTIYRKPFTIRLQNFPLQSTPLRLVMIDTAFDTNDVNEIINVVNGEIKIGSQMLSQLKNGPISLELNLEKEKPLQQTKAGGKLSLRYALKRDFELTD